VYYKAAWKLQHCTQTFRCKAEMQGAQDSSHDGFAGYQMRLGNGMVPRKAHNPLNVNDWAAIIT